MTTLTLCEEPDCSVPITDVTRHKLFITFCKPCGRTQRSKTSGSAKVRRRTTPDGRVLVANDKDVFVSENKMFAIARSSQNKSRFNLYIKGLKVTDAWTLSYCLKMVDTYYRRPIAALTDLLYSFDRTAKSKKAALDYIGPWIEYQHLGIREDPPGPKSQLKTSVSILVNSKGWGSSLQETIDTHLSNYRWVPYIS